ncbi:hypothetical protein PAMP_003535 [Pampus punctatissimus]
MLPKRCPLLPSGEVVLEERTTPTKASEDHVLCQHVLSDQCQLPGLEQEPSKRRTMVQNSADTWDSAHSFPLPTVLKKQRGDGYIHAGFLPSD